MHVSMPGGGSPPWVWLFVFIAFAPWPLALLLLFIREFTGPKPRRKLELDDTTVELWVKERSLPGQGEAIVAPVAPDLKMVAGIAKWIRDATADKIQTEADAVAPLEPGDVFIGSGGKYRFGVAALAVVMDNQKRTTPEWIAESVRKALVQCRERDARVTIIPDMTEDLIRQPQTISDEMRRESCRPIARAILQGIIDSGDSMDTVRIWVWQPVNEAVYVEEFNRLIEQGTRSVYDQSPAMA